MRKSSFAIIAAFVLVGSFLGYRIVQAQGGQGTAKIDGAANVTVVQSTSHKFTVVLSIGASGITADAQNPTFTIPAGFTAPLSTPVANASLVDGDGKWSFLAAGGGCTINSPNAGLTVASGQVITVDVTTVCTVAVPDTITITYQGQSSIAMAATALVIKTADVIGYGAVTAIPSSPTITVTAASATLNVIKHVTNDNGGTAMAGSWIMDVAATNPSDNHFAGVDDLGTAITVDAGAYAVTESGGVSGYTQTSAVGCSGTISAGDTKTCTITNDDNAPSLTLNKIVINDNAGAAHESDWILTATGPTTLFGSGAADSTDVVSGVSFEQGTYTLSESPDLSGYTASVWSCTNSIIVNGSSQITLGLGQSTVCTITNDDILQTDHAAIKVKKEASDYSLRSGPKSVTFTYRVTNEGDVALSDISVKDDKCDSVKYVSGDDNSNDLLDVSEKWVYRCTEKVEKTETNTVTAKGTANGERVKDTDTTKVTVFTPSFPNVGVGPEDKNNVPWSILIPIQGFFMALFLF